MVRERIGNKSENLKSFESSPYARKALWKGSYSIYSNAG